MGETELSKSLLELDFQEPIRSWRSGHIAYPYSLAIASEALGYEFSSTYSSNDILTNFPYYTIHDGSFSGHPSSILEIPMTIADMFASDPIDEMNYVDKVGVWSDVNKRYDRNNSSLVLLIHPNRGWKLNAQEAFLDSLLPTQGVVSFEEYGEFWRKRDSLEYHTEIIAGGTGLKVSMDSEIHPQQSFVVDTFGLTQVTFFDQFGVAMDFKSQLFSGSKLLYFQEDWTSNMTIVDNSKIKVYPNPTKGVLFIHLEENIDGSIANLYDITGMLVETVTLSSNLNELSLKTNLVNGIYLLEIRSNNDMHLQKIVLQR